MKKKYKLIDLDCANCAQKMEDAINKLPEVEQATLNFMTLRLTISSETADWDKMMQDVVAIFAKIEPDSRVIIR